MKRAKPSDQELEELREKSTPVLIGALERMVRALGYGSPSAEEYAERKLQDAIARILLLAELLGRRRTVLLAEARAARKEPPPGFSLRGPRATAYAFREGAVAATTFWEAVENLRKRIAMPVDFFERLTAEAKRKAFTLARESKLTVMRRVRDKLAEFVRQGVPETPAKKILSEMRDWTQSYAGTVYRTNLVTAYIDGRFRQMDDPDISAVLGAFEFRAVMDADTRPNHAAANGLVAAPHDPIWRIWKPPVGFNCRCDALELDRWELKSRGLLTADGRVKRRIPAAVASGRFKPDPGFGGVR